MSFLIQYRPLFLVQILHEYYLTQESSLYSGLERPDLDRLVENQQENYDVSRDFQITPTQDCKSLLNRYNLFFKQDGFGFFVACKVTGKGDGTFVPFIPLEEPLCLSFAISLQNQYVYNFSNLRLEKDLEKKDQFLYYFSNRANNVVNPEALYLSLPVPRFDSSYAYEAGEIILRSTNPAKPSMLEAIEDNGPGTYKKKHWMPIFTDADPLPQFVTKKDRLVVRPKIFQQNVEKAASEKFTFIIYNADGVEVKKLDFKTSVSGTPLSECELNLSDLPSALYNSVVQDGSGNILPDFGLRFFLDNALFNQRPFALIQCFHMPDGSLNEYRWLDQDNDNRILSPEYTMRWKNRSTFWRYYYASPPEFTSSQVKIYEPAPGNPIDRILVSNQPLGLTQIGRRIEIDIDGETLFLPNPDEVSIFPEGNRVYSEINMGGGLGPPQPD